MWRFLIVFAADRTLLLAGKTLKGIPNNPVLLLRDLHFRGDARQKRRLILINTKNACMYTLQAMTPSAQQSWYKGTVSGMGAARGCLCSVLN